MITKQFIEDHFKLHNKLTVYTKDGIRLTVSKAWHYHISGGHNEQDIYDAEDLAEICEKKQLSLNNTERM